MAADLHELNATVNYALSSDSSIYCANAAAFLGELETGVFTEFAKLKAAAETAATDLDAQELTLLHSCDQWATEVRKLFQILFLFVHNCLKEAYKCFLFVFSCFRVLLPAALWTLECLLMMSSSMVFDSFKVLLCRITQLVYSAKMSLTGTSWMVGCLCALVPYK